ncbi:amidohydrolase family protein [Brevibacillus ruminantium]|uniref:adenine deaminase n=1 Tax=Brevibacillus ruminantium TaxID=2950604 RepID=A0ABY4WJS6_9BACL|nr:adenine deaminase C-terminal domain-containing protein [Brevibacillus ruminantium]USG66413.1 amidohydrolase family protein [Brevibacillus ruminantium]
MRIRPIGEADYLKLLRVARREEAADMWIKGAKVLHVYTKEWREVHIAVSGERIAYVGEKEPVIGHHTEVIEAAGSYAVPGYIEPHAHPFQWYNPFTLADFALERGTTTLISDSLMLMSLPFEQVAALMEKVAKHPVKQYFWGRLDPQMRRTEAAAPFDREGLNRMLEHPRVIQGGELTDWQGVLKEDETLLYGIKRTLDLGKRMEGHHPGASEQTLNIAAAAGITACHESMTAQEVLRRLRLGMYATLRHSSIRPDLPILVQGLIEAGIPWSPRMMLTSDGSTPPMYRQGLMDGTIRVAIEAGMPPEEAYVMATLNPAVYYGIDSEVGGIAPGRLADLLLLATPEEPTPHTVIANGQLSAKGGSLLVATEKPEWSDYHFPPVTDHRVKVDEAWFSIEAKSEKIPVIQMLNAVITKLEYEDLPVDDNGHVSLVEDPELAFICLINLQKNRMTQAVVRGYGKHIEGLASTYTASDDWLVLGRNAQAMAQALQRVLELGGGVVACEQGKIVCECPLPLAGRFSPAPMSEVMEMAEGLTRWILSKGYPHLDPLYSLLFFTATHLPYVRLSAEGIVEVKTGDILVPSQAVE